MALFKKIKSLFKDNSCQKCYADMDEEKRQLFMFPAVVGHYVHHDEADYYLNNLVPVSKKADIPTGVYACGAIKYNCPKCGHKMVKLSIFLPVRDQEKYEDTIFYNDGEVDDLFK